MEEKLDAADIKGINNIMILSMKILIVIIIILTTIIIITDSIITIIFIINTLNDINSTATTADNKNIMIIILKPIKIRILLTPIMIIR